MRLLKFFSADNQNEQFNKIFDHRTYAVKYGDELVGFLSKENSNKIVMLAPSNTDFSLDFESSFDLVPALDIIDGNTAKIQLTTKELANEKFLRIYADGWTEF